jgi:hypothetical protein
MADLRRITVEDVRAALAELPGFRLQAGVTFDPAAGRCCPIGALAAVASPRYRAGEIGPDPEDAREIIGLDWDYGGGFMTGFDTKHGPYFLDPRYDDQTWALRRRDGHADGRAVRAAFGVAGGLAS